MRVSIPFIALTSLLTAAACLAQSAASSAGWVVIPVGEYGALRGRAYPSTAEPESAPVDATLTRAEYDLSVNDGLAAGRARLTIDVMKDGYVRVPVPQGLMVREARLDGKLVALVHDKTGGGQLSVLLSKRGRAILELDVAVPVSANAGDEKLSLPPTASGVVRATIGVPRQDLDFRVAGGLLTDKTETPTDTKWLVYGRGSEPLALTWHRKTQDHAVELPLRLRGALRELVSTNEDATSVYAEVDIDVLQGAARSVKIHVPDTVTINQIQGAAVADWDLKDCQLFVTFLEAVDKNARFTITGETHLAREGKMEIPLLRLQDLERESGGVALEILGAGEIKDVQSSGLEKVDASELAQSELGATIAGRQSPALEAFRIRQGSAGVSRSLSVQVVRYTQQAVLTANIEEARYRALMSVDGKTLVEARFAVRNNQRNFVRIKLPAGAEVWSSSLAGRPVRPGQSPDGSLLFPLMKARTGEEAPVFAIEILYLSRGNIWSEKGRADLALPALDLPVSRTGVALFYPPVFRIAPEPGAFRTAIYEKPSSSALSSSAVAPRTGAAAPAVNAATQMLVDQYRAQTDARSGKASPPLRASFPAVGPSVFLVAELTGENQTSTVALSYQKDRKGGVK